MPVVVRQYRSMGDETGHLAPVTEIVAAALEENVECGTWPTTGGAVRAETFGCLQGGIKAAKNEPHGRCWTRAGCEGRFSQAAELIATHVGIEKRRDCG